MQVRQPAGGATLPGDAADSDVTVVLRGHHPGAHGRHRVRQTLATQGQVSRLHTQRRERSHNFFELVS